MHVTTFMSGHLPLRITYDDLSDHEGSPLILIIDLATILGPLEVGMLKVSVNHGSDPWDLRVE